MGRRSSNKNSPYFKKGQGGRWKSAHAMQAHFANKEAKYKYECKVNTVWRREEPKVSLREDQVGITEVVSKGGGFTGVVKSRFSDFQVNEIDLSGKILELNDLTVPRSQEETLSVEEMEAAREDMKDVITLETWGKIATLSEAKPKAKSNAPIEIDVTNLDKQLRAKIHKILRTTYEDKFVTTTGTIVTKNKSGEGSTERKLLSIVRKRKKNEGKRNHWKFKGKYVYFLVHKENLDTHEVATAIADRMRLRPSQVNYAGTKDKRAKTTQKFCIKNRHPEQIVKAVKGIFNVHIGNFDFGSEVLKLGDLKGNRFRIALRHVSGDKKLIEKSLENMREQGFINYFGLQRFGNCASIPTYEVGVALLKSDYKTACELILKPRENDAPFMRAIREAWWKNRDSAAAGAMFRGDRYIEKKLLDGLAQYGEKDYASALRKIPRNMLLLYPHAFQSIVFNRVASRRIKEFGLKLIPGDLVYRNKDEVDTLVETTTAVEIDENTEQESSTTKKSEPEEETEKVKSEDDSADNAETTPDVPEAVESVFKRKVKALTAEDIASGEYTIFDVVLSLPGYDVTYPENEVAKWYEDVLESYGLSSEKLRHNVKTFSMAGAYRKMLIKPEKMSWEFCKYDNPEGNLIVSDWEAISYKEPETAATGKFTALLLDLCLPTSVYATMMLRELLKRDTSAASQTQLEQSEMKKAAGSSKDVVPAAEKRKAASTEYKKDEVKKTKTSQ